MRSCFRLLTVFPVLQFYAIFSRIFSQNASRAYLLISAVLEIAQTFGCKNATALDHFALIEGFRLFDFYFEQHSNKH